MSISEIGGDIRLTSSYDTRPRGAVAMLKSLPLALFKGMVKKSLLQDLNDIKSAVERA